MKFFAAIAAVTAQLQFLKRDEECHSKCFQYCPAWNTKCQLQCDKACEINLISLNSSDAFSAIRTDIFNEDVNFDTLSEHALTSRAAQNIYAERNFLMQLDEDTCWSKCVLYQPAHMCQYACNQQETFVPPSLMSLDDLIAEDDTSASVNKEMIDTPAWKCGGP